MMCPHRVDVFGFVQLPLCSTYSATYLETTRKICTAKGYSRKYLFGSVLIGNKDLYVAKRLRQPPASFFRLKEMRHFGIIATADFESSPTPNESTSSKLIEFLLIFFKLFCTPDVLRDTDSTNLIEDELSKEEEEEVKKPYVPDNLPSWLRTRNPWIQLVIMLALYTVHLLFLSKKGWDFSKKLAPPDRGRFDAIGLDTISGLVVVIIAAVIRKMASQKLIPKMFHVESPPWVVPSSTHKKLGATTLLLFVAYLASGYAAVFCEQILLLLSFYGVPLTVASLRAWKVLLGHLVWVYMAVKILGSRLEPFFPPEGTWLKWRLRSNWLWWVIGGYYASGLLFNIADTFNQWILPSSLFNDESVVSKLVKPENNDLFAMAIGAIGPCITAPVFEEVLYRGYLLPALAAVMPIKYAVPLSSVLFALHHLNLGSVIPLTVLGWAWALLYAHSRNLLVTILIHALWNSRVFLGSLLGL
eukprot:jgi/Galph1/5978/GphlegSOOS_G4587.1